LAERRGIDAGLLLAALSVMPVDWQLPHVYEPRREEAERRMAKRDPEDWPTVALALARSLPIWSQDRDMEAAGVTVYTTGELLDPIREAGGGGELA
jgi:predicted nucleic acid-binding protein